LVGFAEGDFLEGENWIDDFRAYGKLEKIKKMRGGRGL